MRALVLRGRVVPPLARGAREGDDLPHRLLRDLRDDAGPHRPPPLPARKPPLPLPRHRRAPLDLHHPVVPGHPPHHHLPPRPPPPPRTFNTPARPASSASIAARPP